MLLHKLLYRGGTYNTLENAGAITYVSFMDSYMVLKRLPGFTDIQANGRNTFLCLANETTLSVALLDGPEYDPAISNPGYEEEHSIRSAPDGRKLDLGRLSIEVKKHYNINMASLIQLGRWFDYLRENDVYDNTRIIVVSDHGFFLGLFGFDLR